MTHEYTIATNGVILGAGDEPATAVAWAESTILAVGDDTSVRAISRGDSTFVDLRGGTVTAGRDPGAARTALRTAILGGSVAQLVARAGRIETGSPADLLIWSRDPRELHPDEAEMLELVGSVRGGRLELSG